MGLILLSFSNFVFQMSIRSYTFKKLMLLFYKTYADTLQGLSKIQNSKTKVKFNLCEVS